MKKQFIKVKSKFNSDEYYTSPSFPTKEIDGAIFIGVVKSPKDTNILYMKKDNIMVIK